MFEEIFGMQAFDEEAEFMPLIPADEDDTEQSQEEFPERLPVLALKNTVLFPGIVIPITIGRERSIKAIKRLIKSQK